MQKKGKGIMPFVGQANSRKQRKRYGKENCHLTNVCPIAQSLRRRNAEGGFGFGHLTEVATMAGEK
jgi:hypothetical protein